MKIGVVSLGCVKNRVDTEQMLSLLTQAGHEFTTDPAQAEVLLVNTCGFIDPAKEESIQTILEMAQYKRTGRCKKLIVTGCLAQRYGDALLSDMPEIDALLGVNQYAQIVQAVEEAIEEMKPEMKNIDETSKQALVDGGMTLIEYDDSFYQEILALDTVQALYDKIDADVNGLGTTLQEELAAAQG